MICVFPTMQGRLEIVGLLLMESLSNRTNSFTRGLLCAPNIFCCKLLWKCTREKCRKSCTVISDQIQQVHKSLRLSSPYIFWEHLCLSPHIFLYCWTLSSKFFSILCSIVLRIIFWLMRRLRPIVGSAWGLICKALSCNFQSTLHCWENA